MDESFDNIKRVFESGPKDAKILCLEGLTENNSADVIRMIISKLDDKDVQIRGEAFSCLVLNTNDISKYLIESLDSDKRYVKSFAALILANRKDRQAIPKITEMTSDQSSLVRSCALGALGYLGATGAKDIVRGCFSDEDLEVRKSALKAAMDLKCEMDLSVFAKFSEKDEVLEKLLYLAKQNQGGPGGI